MEEIWKDIPDYEGYYQASNLGRIKSLERLIWVSPSKNGKKGYFRKQKERILKSSFGRHLHLSLWKENILYQANLHNLVLLTFKGPRPDGLYGCHKDDDPMNNNITNLYWGTPKENSLDKKINGNQAFGSETNSAKLTGTKVKEIRNLKNSLSQRKISEKFGITQSQVSRIINLKQWNHENE